jgi:hypothetical protein
MDLVTIAMLLVGLLLIAVYVISLGMDDEVVFKGDTDELRKKAQATYSNSMAVILALGAVMVTLSLIMIYKPDAISAPKARIIHIMMVGVALSVMITASVAIDQINKDASGTAAAKKGKDLSAFLGVSLLPASIAAVLLGSLVVWKPDALKLGGSKRFGFDFEF